MLAVDHAARPADYPSFARALVDAGVTVDVRYLCTTEGVDDSRARLNAMKVARPEEVRAAMEEGLAVSLIWQQTKSDSHGGAIAGSRYGADAARQAKTLGYPPDRTIWVACADYDAPASDHDRIASYTAAFRRACDHPVGGYGKRSVLDDLLGRGVIDRAWQSYGFSRPVGEVSPAAAMYQRREQRTFAGITCDINDVLADIGAWHPGGGPVLNIVTRSEWGAAPTLPPTRMKTLPSQYLWLHHTATDAWHGTGGVRACQKFHMQSRGYTDIGYSFLVDVDGTVYEGRGAGVVGAHTLGLNSVSHAICCLGDFTATSPPAPMLAAVADLVAHGHQQGWWPNTISGGHRDAPGNQTSCPGDLLERRIHDLRSMIAQRLARPTPQPAPSEDDLLMAIALNDNDARRAWCRQHCLTFWGHEPSADELDWLAAALTTAGADAVLAGIADHQHAAALRARRGW